jgi:hypothetical protein
MLASCNKKLYNIFLKFQSSAGDLYLCFERGEGWEKER